MASDKSKFAHKKSKIYRIIGIICVLPVLFFSFSCVQQDNSEEPKARGTLLESPSHANADTSVKGKSTFADKGMNSESGAETVSVDKIEIPTIKEITLKKSGENYVFDTVVIMRNENSSQIKMRNCTFELSFGFNDASMFNLGKTKYDEIHLKPWSSSAASDTTVRFTVNHGSEITDLNNLSASIKKPSDDNNYTIPFSIRGKFDLGTETAQGWLFKKGVEIDFVYKPEVERDVISNLIAAINSETDKVLIAAVPKVVILFEFDSSSLTESAKILLRDWVSQNRNAIEKISTGVMHIEGHTDDIGDPNYNELISVNRVNAVNRYLSSNLGLKWKNVEKMGFGEKSPISKKSITCDRAKNRRVEVYLTPE